MFSLSDLVNYLSPTQESANQFVGRAFADDLPRVFGGQVLAQALQAAQGTVAENKSPHSIHAHFLRTGVIGVDIFYHVELIRDGASFSTRLVTAEQNGKSIFQATISFHISEDGLVHQQSMPIDIPSPDSLENESDRRHRLGIIPRNIMMNLLTKEMVDIRMRYPMDQPETPHTDPVQGFWFKFNRSIGESSLTHQALIAFVSDMGLLSTGLRPHIDGTTRENIQAASLDHALWFHGPVRADQWTYYHCDSPIAGSGRNFNRGSFYTEDGRLIASTAQEALIRLRNDI